MDSDAFVIRIFYKLCSFKEAFVTFFVFLLLQIAGLAVKERNGFSLNVRAFYITFFILSININLSCQVIRYVIYVAWRMHVAWRTARNNS